MSKVVFYCRVKKELLETVEFYKQDIDALKALNDEVVICTRYREIPFDFDVLFIWWWSYATWPVLLARLLGKPSIVTGTFNFRFPENFVGRDYFSRPWFHRLLIKYAVKAASLNIFVSRLEHDACTKYFNISNAQYCHHSLSNDYLQGPSPQRELSIFNVSWSGKLNLARKGIPELLKAVEILKKEEKINTKVYLAGHRGDGYDYLKKIISDLGINDNVQLLGEVSKEQKIYYLRRCEIYVQPSHYEGFGLAMAEAMGSGACVITCRVGAVGEVVGNAGLYVTPGSEKELAGELKKIINNNELRQDYQVRAYKRAKKMFSHEKKVKFLRDILSNIT